MAGTYTPTGDQRSLDWLFTTTSPVRPTTWFMALHTGANGGSGANNEIVGNGYARQSVAFTRASNVVSNSAAITFGPDTTAAWGVVTDISIWDSVTGGTCLAAGTAASSVNYAVGDSATVAAAAFTITLS